VSRAIGIYGGSFDPIHIAHLRAALEVAETEALAKVLFIPCAIAPHGKALAATPAQRLEMVRLAVEGQELFEVSDIEVRRGGPSRTLYTLEELNRIYPGVRLQFILGADAFFSLHTWYEPLRLFELADFLVMRRPGAPTTRLAPYLQRHLHPRFSPSPDGWVRLGGAGGAKWVETTAMDISSSDIKRRVAQGLSITYLVPPQVEEYIKSTGLYRR